MAEMETSPALNVCSIGWTGLPVEVELRQPGCTFRVDFEFHLLEPLGKLLPAGGRVCELHNMLSTEIAYRARVAHAHKQSLVWISTERPTSFKQDIRASLVL